MESLPLYNWKIQNSDTNLSFTDVFLHARGLAQNHLDDFRLSERLHDPYLMRDMDRAVSRIEQAIAKRENITIFGDYDADGVISTALMVKLFRKIDVPVKYIIPSRQNEGYGLRVSGVEKALELNTRLLITVDNGITAVEAVDAANKAGIDVIIFDHHLQEGDLPAAYAVVNPNRTGCEYPFKGLCGAGVVYKLFQALGKKLFSEKDYKNFMLMHLDLVALATVADVVPIRDENYAIVKFGLKSINQTLRPGIVELKRVCGLIGKEITTTAVGFYMAPRLNVAGRLEAADHAVELLLSESREKAEELAARLNSLNKKRQKMQEDYITEAVALVEQSEMKDNKAYIITGESWETGIIGIISGRLKDQFNRPVIVFTKDNDGNYVGSGRSTDNFHLTDALTQFNHLYITYGGHKKAAGLTVPPENMPVFLKEFSAYVNKALADETPRQDLIIDTIIDPEQLNQSLVSLIQELGPFGEEYPEPVLLLQKARLKDIYSLSDGRHIKLIFGIGSREFECVWWRRGEQKENIEFYKDYDIAFRPSINLWNGRGKLQLIVEDLQLSGSN
ncbi:MAG: single-stranded-DNA-specific exonuclease RecJ [Calditrichales bacterium]|nr:MAG: single-stranded-DNA-specific exonuclease RecJ [Calditrichales bacterium]